MLPAPRPHASAPDPPRGWCEHACPYPGSQTGLPPAPAAFSPAELCPPLDGQAQGAGLPRVCPPSACWLPPGFSLTRAAAPPGPGQRKVTVQNLNVSVWWQQASGALLSASTGHLSHTCPRPYRCGTPKGALCGLLASCLQWTPQAPSGRSPRPSSTQHASAEHLSLTDAGH